MYCRLFRLPGQLRLREIDFLADILQCLFRVDAGVKFELYIGAAFVGASPSFP